MKAQTYPQGIFKLSQRPSYVCMSVCENVCICPQKVCELILEMGKDICILFCYLSVTLKNLTLTHTHLHVTLHTVRK